MKAMIESATREDLPSFLPYLIRKFQMFINEKNEIDESLGTNVLKKPTQASSPSNNEAIEDVEPRCNFASDETGEEHQTKSNKIAEKYERRHSKAESKDN